MPRSAPRASWPVRPLAPPLTPPLPARPPAAAKAEMLQGRWERAESLYKQGVERGAAGLQNELVQCQIGECGGGWATGLWQAAVCACHMPAQPPCLRSLPAAHPACPSASPAVTHSRAQGVGRAGGAARGRARPRAHPGRGGVCGVGAAGRACGEAQGRGAAGAGQVRAHGCHAGAGCMQRCVKQRGPLQPAQRPSPTHSGTPRRWPRRAA